MLLLVQQRHTVGCCNVTHLDRAARDELALSAHGTRVLRLGAPGRALLTRASGEGDEVLKEHLLVRRVALQLEDSAAARCPADKVRGLTPGGEESPLQLRHLARKDGGLCSRRSLPERTFDLKCHAAGVHAIRTLD